MLLVRVYAKVIQDDAGVSSEIPVLLDENREVVKPLVNYVLKLKRDGRSNSTINNYIKATQLLLEYIAANKSGFESPKTLFEAFSCRLYTGTIDENGLDPSGLYWLPCSKQTARVHIRALSNLTDWLAEKHGAISMNPMVKADSFSQQLSYAAWFRKNQHDFLGHIKDKHISQTVRYARSLQGKRPLGKQNGDGTEFPEHHFNDFFFNGLGGSLNIRIALRDQLILLLMHGGGLRVSEALHLWLDDVFVDHFNSDSVIVRIYHPEDGKAPHDWRSRSGKTTRPAYLKEKYALMPRTQLSRTEYVGWKGSTLDHISDGYLDVHWFPKIYGQVFATLWRSYIKLLTGVEATTPMLLSASTTAITALPIPSMLSTIATNEGSIVLD